MVLTEGAWSSLLLPFTIILVQCSERGDYHDGLNGLGAHTCGVPGQMVPPDMLNDVFEEIAK